MGTGIFEPFSRIRVTVGILPIVDVVIWGIMIVGLLVTRVKPHFPRFKVWRMALLVIVFHISLQAIQGYVVYNEAAEDYDKVTLSASFIPGQFTVITKKDSTVNLYQSSIWTEKSKLKSLISEEDADLDFLFDNNPKAKVLMQWSPFVVIIQTDNKVGLYDPRFYRNGESFLFEYIEFD
ncbi:hypothetical protein [Halalkalibacter krulwichiae]|uniref:hypothetical protein n=1 Tax=Halalkalibacter krulwichiae TaxID=199441 RepID=UPI002148FA46|nr:hypothetical protein [Halalkalibacter krulwichiae]